MWSRRRFLTTFGVGGGLATVGGGLGATGEPPVSSVGVRGERHGGFVLLPEGAPPPIDVEEPRRPMPIMCGTGAGRGGAEPNALNEELGSDFELATLGEVKVYTLGPPLRGIGFDTGEVVRYANGELFAASLVFSHLDPRSGSLAANVRLMIEPNVPRPYPFWSETPVEPGGLGVQPEQVHFLPAPGLRIRLERGFVFHWLEEATLYTLVIDSDVSAREAREIASSLTHIGG